MIAIPDRPSLSYASLLRIILLLAAVLHGPAAVHAQAPLETTLRIVGVPDELRLRLRDISALADRKAPPIASYGALAARLDADIKGFDRLLRALGYYDVRISHSIASDKRPIEITVSIDPGPLYLVGEITIRILDRPEDAALLSLLRARMTLAPGDPVVAGSVIAAEAALLAALPENGHPEARVHARRVVIDHDSRTARILYRLTAGPEIRFGPLEISGLETVKPGFPARLVPWKEGDLYEQARVEAFRKRLVGTRLFQRVGIGVALPDDVRSAEDGAYPILVSLAESRHRTISGGAGFTTAEGFGGEVQWEHRNALGAGERLVLTARGAEIEQSLSARLTKPHFRRLDQELVLDLAAKRENTDAFDSLGAEARAGIERKLGAHWRAGLATELSFSSIKEQDMRRDFVLFGVPIAASYDRRDDLLDPHEGVYARAVTTPYLAYQNGSFDFYRHQIDGSFYRSFGADREIVLAARAGLGTMHGAPLERIPANRRFFAGGGGSVRGFDFQNVGPIDASGDPTGGRSRLETSLELRMKLFGDFALVPFLDAGQVWENSLPQFDGLRYGAGLGFRWHTGFAPIRVDLATPLGRRPGEDRIQIYIGIGQSF
ncbi:MAG: autotransporter assembly complex family protein [Rhodothalassiaceae bacterium]